MTGVSLRKLAALPGVVRLLGDARVEVAGVCSDSRRVEPGDLFAALPGRSTELELPARCEVSGDPDALRQVLANLLGNVRVHTPPGTPVRISLTVDDTTACVTVADAGP